MDFWRDITVRRLAQELCNESREDAAARLCRAISERHAQTWVDWQWLGSAHRLPSFDWHTFRF